MKVRVYGRFVGHSSFARVSAGMCEGLCGCGVLAGSVPVDAYDPEEVYGGADAEVAVFAGPPTLVSMMTSVGFHKQRWAMLPANSTWVPDGLVRRMEEHVTGFVAPSQWAVDVLKRYTALPVELYQHGVCAAFTPNQKATLSKGLRVLHMTSTSRQRKGTVELADAWRLAQPNLGQDPWLRLHLSDVWDVEQWLTRGNRSHNLNIEIYSRLNYGPAALSRLLCSYDFICQPSRGEGFGLLPLEALACGVPVIATGCTGHSEYLTSSTPGWVEVPCGPLAPIDDGPGAMAPTVAREDLAACLRHAYAQRDELRAQAIEGAARIHQTWNWTKVSRKWLDRIGEPS